MRIFNLTVAALAVLALGGCCGGGANKTDSGSGTSSTRAAPAAKAAAAAAAAVTLPWLATVDANCASYKEAPNQIKKSAVFRDNEGLLGKTTLQNVEGKLTKIATDQGGSEVRLTVHVGDAEFSTPALGSTLKQGSPVYAAAGDMKEGQCVIFSADQLKASSMSEQAKVCDHEYLVRFTTLKPCG